MDVRRRMAILGRVLLLMVLLPLGTLFYAQIWSAKGLKYHPLNPRLDLDTQTRGAILDRWLRPLVYSGKEKRHYPLGEAGQPLLGYVSRDYGMGGVEAWGNKILSASREPQTLKDGLRHLLGYPLRGRDLVLTIDKELQEESYQQLAGFRGAIFVVDIEQNSLLAAVSRPSLSQEEILYSWNEVSQREDGPLLNRGFQGLYSPGSTLKTWYASWFLEKRVWRPSGEYPCTGELTVDGFMITDIEGGHGSIGLNEALAHSCNPFFCRAYDIDPRKEMDRDLKGMMNRFAKETLVPKVEMELPRFKDEVAWAQSLLGQADIKVTPLMMANWINCLAHRGVWTPLRLNQNLTHSGDRVFQKEVIDKVIEGMELAVTSGTARAAARRDGVAVAGKTGTAEVQEKLSTAWFIGFTPVKDPKIGIVVLLEEAGTGGGYAAPIAGELWGPALQALEREIKEEDAEKEVDD